MSKEFKNELKKKSEDSLLPSLGNHQYPELLRLSDPTWLQVFTHRSYYARPTDVFEDPPDDLSPDNEKWAICDTESRKLKYAAYSLEHLGDSVVSLIVTQLIYETWPGLRVGPATVRTAICILVQYWRTYVQKENKVALCRKCDPRRHVCLLDFLFLSAKAWIYPYRSQYYDLPRWLRIHPSQSRSLKDSQKVQGMSTRLPFIVDCHSFIQLIYLRCVIWRTSTRTFFKWSGIRWRDLYRSWLSCRNVVAEWNHETSHNKSLRWRPRRAWISSRSGRTTI